MANKRIKMLEDKVYDFRKTIDTLTEEQNETDRLIDQLEPAEEEIRRLNDEDLERKEKRLREHYQSLERQSQREVKRLKRELDTYKSRELLELTTEDSRNQARHKYDLNRATTLAIFDSIISAIGNWSTDGQVADDMEFLLQSILFPLVYEPVVRGDEDYFLTEVPLGAYEVVKRGREFVKAYRQQKDVAITGDALLWEQALEEVKEWVTRDALPLLYEIGSEDWQHVVPVDIKDMWKWKEQPMARALEFPLIFDGMELVALMGDDIRKQVDIASFTMATMKTRLEP